MLNFQQLKQLEDAFNKDPERYRKVKEEADNEIAEEMSWR